MRDKGKNKAFSDLYLQSLLLVLILHPGGASHLRHASLPWTGSARVTSADTIDREDSQVLHTSWPALLSARPTQSQVYLVAALWEGSDRD